MKSKIVAMFAFGLLFSIQSFSQVAEQLLSRDIMTSKKVLKSEINLYNYFYLSQGDWVSDQAKRESYIKDYYLSPRAGSFWDADFTDTSTKNWAAGAGLYFAIDPLISKQYGNSFIKITLPAGTPFINVVAPIPLKKDTLAALVSEHFITTADYAILFPKQTGFYRDTFRAMVDPKYSGFRKLVQNIMDANKIQFIEYNFNTSLSGFCSGAKTSAFNYIGTRNLSDVKHAIVTSEFTKTSVYSTEISLPNQSSAEVTAQSQIVKFRSLLEEIAALRDSGKSVKKEFILSRLSAAEYAQIKAETYSCQP